MKKSLMLCGLLLALTASMASAAAGVNLRWSELFRRRWHAEQDVRLHLEHAAPERSSARSNWALICTQASGVEIVVDVATAGATLPAWWAFKNAGTCRPSSLTMNAGFR